MKSKKIVAIFIAYNAQKTLKAFYEGFPKQLFNDIILVDDASSDNTYNLAKKLGIHSYRNPKNLGYGGNMKKALDLALTLGADIIVDIHPDNEYLPTAIPLALKKVKHEGYDILLGNRFTNVWDPLFKGMHFWKVLPIICLNTLDKLILGVSADDLHQGFRVYSRNLLQTVNYHVNSNGYLFSFELIAQTALKGSKVGQVPVEVNYSGNKRGASLKSCVIYSLGTFKVLTLFLLAKIGFKGTLFK